MSDQEETSDEKAERSVSLNHVSHYTMPVIGNLPPSMAILGNEEAGAWVIAKTIGAIEREAARQIWLIKHPGQPLPESMEEKPEDEPLDIVFDITDLKGGARVAAVGLNSFADNLHNVSPSKKGVGRLQAFRFAMAQKSGMAVEPKKRSLWQTIRGKDGQQEQINR